MGFGYSNFWGSPFYPGYYGAPIVIVGKPVNHNPAAYGPRTYNLNTYANPSRPVTSGYSHINSASFRGNDRNGNATYSAPVRVFSNTGATGTSGNNLGGSRYSSSYRGTDGGSSNYSAPRSNNNYNSGSSSPTRSFDSGSGSGSSSSGGGSHSSGGGSAPTRSFSSSPRGKG
jgi:hypothetical protein